MRAVCITKGDYKPGAFSSPHKTKATIYRINELGIVDTATDLGVVSFLAGAPSSLDVPEGDSFPAGTNGSWFVPGENGVQVVPPAERIDPVTGLDWRANLDWQPSSDPPPDGHPVREVVGDNRIQFRRGYPNFVPFVIEGRSYPLPLQHGTQSNGEYDFDEADKKLAVWLQANVSTLPGQAFVEGNSPRVDNVQSWRSKFKDPISDKSRPLTWHHNEDMKTMQLVPGPKLNNPNAGGIVHDGGAKWANAARW